MISSHLRDLNQCWLMWMKYNRIACDPTKDFQVRAEAAKTCETLMEHRGDIVASIDKVFDGPTEG
jgi:hypothetical protein